MGAGSRPDVCRFDVTVYGRSVMAVSIVIGVVQGPLFSLPLEGAWGRGMVYVSFTRGELSLPKKYEVWALAWGTENVNVLYARSPFGAILLERVPVA